MTDVERVYETEGIKVTFFDGAWISTIAITGTTYAKGKSHAEDVNSDQVIDLVNILEEKIKPAHQWDFEVLIETTDEYLLELNDYVGEVAAKYAADRFGSF